jgi:hypothetical protein
MLSEQKLHNLSKVKTVKERRFLLQRAERHVDTRAHLQQRVQTRKLTNLFKRPLTSLLRLFRKSRATFFRGVV